LLNQVIDRLHQVNVSRIIVVDNNSENDSRQKLRAKEYDLKGTLTVITLPENTGSAGGYKAGLEFVHSNNGCDYIWLLDDDNVPHTDALKVIVDYWNTSGVFQKEKHLCLFSYREHGPAYKELARRDSSSIDPIIGGRNSILGFTIMRPFSTRKNSALYREEFKERDIIMPKNHGRIPVAPYGGMFFHRALLDVIGYPDEKLFLYGDDYEYSYRIVRYGGEIILLHDSRIEDIAPSENIGMQVEEKNIFRLYYSTRNHVYFQKSLADNKLLYTVNYFIYLFYLKIKQKFSLHDDSVRISVISKAINDGFHGRLGKENSLSF
jgi:GT2 family glycosyltransferase